MSAPRLQVHGASKTFGETKVLDDVALSIEPGEIHALVGQNGSGKSTLIKILTGYHTPDHGMSIHTDGQPLALPVRWSAARAAGLSVVHQDLGLIDDESVSENVGIGGFVRHPVTRRIDWRRQHEVTTETLARVGLHLDPTAPVGRLPAAHRAGVAIARALRDLVPGRGLVILDEATRALPKEQLDRFHELLRRIVETGTSVLMISHNLPEVLSVSDKVTALRDGRVAGGGLATAGLTEADLARLMLGKTVDRVVRRSRREIGAGEAAAIRDIRLGQLDPFSVVVGTGEVVGLTGLPGTGFEDLPAVLGGARRAASGALRTPAGERDLTRAGVRRALAQGVAVVPERRLAEGLAADLSIRDNLALPTLRRRGRPWFVGARWQDRLALTSIRRFSVRAQGAHHVIRELSGGNQQKVLFAKWLSVEPRLMVLHEPTQGVDVGARADLLDVVRRAADEGAGVLLVTSEPSDLVQVCDRILVARVGRPLLELHTDDPDEVVDAVYSASKSKGAVDA